MRAGFKVLFSACVAAGLVVTACGDDSTTKNPTSPPPKLSTTTVVVEPPGQLDAGDQSAAQDAVLTTGDFPAGWKSSPWQLGDQPMFGQAKTSCTALHAVDATEGLRAVAHSSVLQSPRLEVVASKVQVYPTAEDAQAALAAFTRPDAGECISSSVSAAQSGPQAGSPKIDIGPTALSTPSALAFFGTVSGGAGAGPASTVSLGYAAAVRGRALVLITTQGVGAKKPDFASYLEPVLGRLAPFA